MEFLIKKVDTNITDFTNELFWDNANAIKIGNYLWMNNNYRPDVIVKALYSDAFIFLFYKVFEEKVWIKHTEYGSDVWKDSCVEFFFNPFPGENEEYVNIEINAIGTMLIGKGRGRENREYIDKSLTKDFEIISSIKKVINGKHGAKFWSLYCKIPLKFYEELYDYKFSANMGKANFYKCGDETEFPHYGVWNNIESNKIDFHVPEFFGNIFFEKEKNNN